MQDSETAQLTDTKKSTGISEATETDSSSSHHEEVQMITIKESEEDTFIPIEDRCLDPQKPAKLSSSVFNLGNTAVGAGILAFPWAVAQIGYSSAIILIIIFGLMTAFTLNTQSMVNRVIRPQSSYETCSLATKPKLGWGAYLLKWFANFIVALSTFGIVCAYLIIVGDLLPDVVRHFSENEKDFLYDRRFWIGIYIIIFILPTIYHRKLDALRYVSLFVLLAYSYVLIVMMIYSAGGLDPCPSGHIPPGDATECVGEFREHPQSALNYFKSIPTFIFAYGCQINTFGLVNELKNCTISRINQVIFYTMIFVGILYSLVGYVGYFTYGANCTSNLLVAYPHDHEAVLVARILLSISIIFSYPVILQPCKHASASLFFRVENASKLALSNIKFYIMTTIILGLSILVSMLVDDMGVVVSIVGILGINFELLILPGIFYWFMPDLENNEYCYKCKKITGILLSLFGVVLIPFCIVMLFV